MDNNPLHVGDNRGERFVSDVGRRVGGDRGLPVDATGEGAQIHFGERAGDEIAGGAVGKSPEAPPVIARGPARSSRDSIAEA